MGKVISPFAILEDGSVYLQKTSINDWAKINTGTGYTYIDAPYTRANVARKDLNSMLDLRGQNNEVQNYLSNNTSYQTRFGTVSNSLTLPIQNSESGGSNMVNLNCPLFSDISFNQGQFGHVYATTQTVYGVGSSPSLPLLDMASLYYGTTQNWDSAGTHNGGTSTTGHGQMNIRGYKRSIVTDANNYDGFQHTNTYIVELSDDGLSQPRSILGIVWTGSSSPRIKSIQGIEPLDDGINQIQVNSGVMSYKRFWVLSGWRMLLKPNGATMAIVIEGLHSYINQ